MKNFFCILTSLIVFVGTSHASHNRAGEITYKYKGGYTYEITVVTYTKESSKSADKQFLTVYFGDGDSAAAVNRINGPNQMGESLGNDTKKNIYVVTHTYAGPSPGSKPYKITMFDPNRVNGVINMYDSFNTPFYIESDLYINPLLIDHNESPILLNPPLDDACVGRCFYHNPAAHDPDGDSLSYELVPSLGTNGKPVAGFSIPNPGPNGSTYLNPITGDFSWCVPQALTYPDKDEYNIAIRITEWRKVANKWFRIGTVLRDMQITVRNCTNEPPKLVNVRDTCIEAGGTLDMIITATDIDGDYLTLTASGGPFVVKPSATFPPVGPSPQPVFSTFSWKTNCDLIRKQPYSVIFKAKDNGTKVQLTDIKNMFITIVAPATKIVSATPKCSEIKLDWLPAPCNSALNPAVSYYVYRKSECDKWKPGPCDKGMPDGMGYKLVGILNGYSSTSFVDNNGGAGLTHGIDYAYRIVISYLDGSLSYASEPFCVRLRRDVPIITNADVLSTSPTTGTINVKWLNPLTTPGNLDTLAHKGPYKYMVYGSPGFTGTSNLITSIVSPTFAGLTNYITDINLNTANTAYNYRIDFYANDTLICKTKDASSVYLSLAPDDKKLVLTWQYQTPWSNYLFYIYKETPTSSGNWVLRDSTTNSTYVDDSLINGQTYCYKIKAVGRYTDTTLPRPLVNWSEEKCGEPKDKTPPCKIKLNIDADCEAGHIKLTWNNPNLSCSTDAMYYNIYFTPNPSKEMKLLRSITDINTTVLTDDTLKSIAGCYAITAVDSTGNEGVLSDTVCADNCPYYELPNVFTPNGDNKNDYFTPLPRYRFIHDIDIKIYNRWGALVFSSTDPNINWDGNNQATKVPCTDGTYFYVCLVNSLRLNGMETRTLRGYVQLFREK